MKKFFFITLPLIPFLMFGGPTFANSAAKSVTFKIDYQQYYQNISFSLGPEKHGACSIVDYKTVKCKTDNQGRILARGYFVINHAMGPDESGPMIEIKNPANSGGNFVIYDNGWSHVNASLSSSVWPTGSNVVTITLTSTDEDAHH